MKQLLAFILLLIVTTAISIPCCIYDDCTAGTNLPHNDGQDSEMGCSPFFSCANCSGFAWESKMIEVPELSSSPLAYADHLAPAQLSTFVKSFWQPPRVDTAAKNS